MHFILAADNGIQMEHELWKYDGVNPPTMIMDIYGGSNGGYPQEFIIFNNKLLFVANQPSTGAELWEYDGINVPTMVQDIFVGSSGAWPEYLIEFNNKLYFQAHESTYGNELWVYDGINPPSIVHDINPGGGSSSPYYPTIFNGKLYFSAEDGINGRELWAYDGTNTPTIVYNINPSAGSHPQDLLEFNNKLHFVADDGTNDYELWGYDGINSPSMIYDIYPGGNSSPWGLTLFNNSLYFTANNGVNGHELWKYDGVNPPIMLFDINPFGVGFPEKFAVFNNALYFSADDGTVGKELWKLCYSSTVTLNPSVCSSYTSPSGNYTWTSSGTYTDTLVNLAGCDSIITINLTVNYPNSATINPTACNSYTSPSGNNVWTASGTYTDTIPTTSGCDSVITINLTINSINASTSQNGNILTANATGAQYQWLNCTTNQVIAGETSQSFTASANGNYAVIVTENGCTDTSSCLTVTTVGIRELNTENVFLYPNPAKQTVQIVFEDDDIRQVYLLNLLGEELAVWEVNNKAALKLPSVPSGTYFLKIDNHEKSETVKKIVIR